MDINDNYMTHCTHLNPTSQPSSGIRIIRPILLKDSESETPSRTQNVQNNYWNAVNSDELSYTQALAAAGYFVNCVANLLSLTRTERKTQLLKVLHTPNP